MPDPVPETKPWYLSKGVIGSVVAVIGVVLTILKRPDQAAAIGAESAGIGLLVGQIAGVVGALVALWGRLAAKATITK